PGRRRHVHRHRQPLRHGRVGGDRRHGARGAARGGGGGDQGVHAGARRHARSRDVTPARLPPRRPEPPPPPHPPDPPPPHPSQAPRPAGARPAQEPRGALPAPVDGGKGRSRGGPTGALAEPRSMHFGGWKMGESLWLSERRTLERFVSTQPPYSILTREAERE